MKKVFLLFILGILTGYSYGQLSVYPYFTHNMVLQRNTVNKIWGKTNAGDKIIVSIHGLTKKAVITSKGDWTVELPPFEAGGPYTLTITGKKGSIALDNVVFGDVWLCSGQSNMEYQVSAFPWANEAVSKANNTSIRYIEVPNRIDEIPLNDLPPGTKWMEATNNNIRNLSATSYWFAANLQPEVNVPVGLIVADWSGTGIEPWMSLEAMKKFPQFKSITDYLGNDPKSHSQIEKEFQEYLKKDWGPKYYYKDIGFDEKWYVESTDYSKWDSIKLPCFWENAGLGLEHHDGSVWFRTTFDFPANYKDSMVYVDLNMINDYDITWINGHQIGQTFGEQNWRQYWVNRKYLREKGNSLVIRVFDIGGNGGLNFHPLWGNAILNGKWVCKKGIAIDPDTVPVPRIVNKSPYSYPTVLFNAMINPVHLAKLTGVIWYQGESNAGRAREYSELFPALIECWRKEFQAPDLPFLFVQLANFEPEPELPGNSDWAELRESQEKALHLPHTGMAVTIDIGEAYNIHPANKMEVGRRLALQALQKVYSIDTIAESPSCKGMSTDGDSIVLDIETYGDHLVTTSKYGYVNGFAIASGDKVFSWAKALIRDNKIIVWNENVKNPVAVRYAWSKNPGPLNVYNKSGLPLRPFRTDSWQGITDERVYDPDKVFF
jgi:sialate O-acetylesterase